ncbi:ABC transporter substrate-binding protein [Enterovirga rhinocerotis]|uniref:NitT/TauT family transport system substrate-binding protein n=1 Tax=Enterovirga rhinocerotis TaxID=1339210 RepID=A0A4R7BIR3_9HYPH|nr:ABC transporter substrate-binding protein [Enterovirga rhinocerotis]TDR85220.1 NitT/TauT family transport system substrate-binding protein [Enterovirga rhinocerotis]
MQPTRHWIRALRAAGVGLAVAALSAIPATAQEKLTVRLDFSPWGVHAGMHLAKEKGWFKEAGLDVEVQDGRGSGNTLQLVNAGQADVGQIQLGLLPQARANGAQLKGFAGFGRRTDLAVLVDKDSPIQKVSDFAGKTLVVFAASPWAPYIDHWLKQGGLDRTKTTITFVDPAALWGTYTAKRADGLMSTEPSAVPVAAATRPSKAILAEDAGIAYPSYGLVATEKTIAAKKEALSKLVEIQQKAWAYMRDGKIEEGVDAIVKQRPDAKLDRKALAEQIRLTIAFFDTPATKGKPIGWQAESDWEVALKGLEAAGAVKPGWKVSDYYTNDLVK